MQIETLLPLGNVGPGLREPPTPLELGTVYDDAKLVEELGDDEAQVRNGCSHCHSPIADRRS